MPSVGESWSSPANLRAAHNLSHSVNYDYGDDDYNDADYRDDENEEWEHFADQPYERNQHLSCFYSHDR